MRIQNNLTALNTFRNYGIANGKVAKAAEKLASGYRINRAGDDAAGLAISEKMRAQIRGLNMASKNAQDAVSLVQTAEGALQTAHDVLQRMRELAVQSASDSNENSVDRNALNLEFNQLISELDQMATVTDFNSQKLLAGGAMASNGLTFQVGANAGDIISITIGGISSGAASIKLTGVSVPTRAAASAAIKAVNSAINAVSTMRAKLGALQNRLEFKIANLDVSAENLQAAESRIRDVDMAKEMTTFNKNNIISQAATAMLAQANSAPQNVLQLLR